MEEIPIDKTLKKFQYSLTPLRKRINETLLIADLCTKLKELNRMSSTEKIKFESYMERFKEIMDRGVVIAKKAQEIIKNES